MAQRRPVGYAPASHVVATGSTNASTLNENGAAPSLSGEDLLDSVPDLDSEAPEEPHGGGETVGAHADLSVESVSQVPGFDADLDVMATAGERAATAVEAGVDGLVVAGTGLGNTTGDLGGAPRGRRRRRRPSRGDLVMLGRYHRRGVRYAGGRTLRERGVISDGDLAPWKTRLKLALALEAVEREPGVADVARYFPDRVEWNGSGRVERIRSSRTDSTPQGREDRR